MGSLLIAQVTGGVPGDPLAGVTPVEFEEFRLGLDDFLEVETSDEGLGPAYNGTSCGACHSVPAVGGTGHIAEVRAARRGPRGEFVPLDPSGETLFHLFSVPSHSCQPVIPTDATIVARRVPIPLFGAGLVEAIPDESLLALEDPVDRNRDGVSGRAAIITDVASGQRRVGRFGWKAQHATLLSFGADAYRNEMGITNELFPQELAVGVSADRMRVCDLIPEIEDKRDPRTGRRGIDNFASFMKLLAPVGRGPTGEAARLGEQMFGAIGCTACHTPSLETGPSGNPLFHHRRIAVVLGLVAPRHRNRRWDRARYRRAGGDSHTGIVGAPVPEALPARRLGRDARGDHRTPPQRGRSLTARIRTRLRERSRGSPRVPPVLMS